jgi:hypothetical protein
VPRTERGWSQNERAPGIFLGPLLTTSAPYFRAEMAASAFSFAIFMSPA